LVETLPWRANRPLKRNANAASLQDVRSLQDEVHATQFVYQPVQRPLSATQAFVLWQTHQTPIANDPAGQIVASPQAAGLRDFFQAIPKRTDWIAFVRQVELDN
jgi:site-specific recombinase XerC